MRIKEREFMEKLQVGTRFFISGGEEFTVTRVTDISADCLGETGMRIFNLGKMWSAFYRNELSVLKF